MNTSESKSDRFWDTPAGQQWIADSATTLNRPLANLYGQYGLLLSPVRVDAPQAGPFFWHVNTINRLRWTSPLQVSDSWPLERSSLDVVVLLHVIGESAAEMAHLLQESHTTLRSGGLLLIAYVPFWSAGAWQLVKRHQTALVHNTRQLRHRVEQSGFSCVHNYPTVIRNSRYKHQDSRMMPWHIQSALSLFRKTGNGAVPVQKIAFKKRTVPQSQIACRNGEEA